MTSNGASRRHRRRGDLEPPQHAGLRHEEKEDPNEDPQRPRDDADDAGPAKGAIRCLRA